MPTSALRSGTTYNIIPTFSRLFFFQHPPSSVCPVLLTPPGASGARAGSEPESQPVRDSGREAPLGGFMPVLGWTVGRHGHGVQSDLLVSQCITWLCVCYICRMQGDMLLWCDCLKVEGIPPGAVMATMVYMHAWGDRANKVSGAYVL